ncbi:MAG: hypothetical protein AMK69_14940 [Nitrospira bacterium SG8_3]|nr:MAG: hypothetical protein AMK69_14940 [Nitrospira bacterium SG8_3]
MQSDKTVIPGKPKNGGRDPCFDKLTILSEAEGESRKVEGNQIILDPGSCPAPRDLAGMTNYDAASKDPALITPRRGVASHCHNPVLFRSKA